MNAMASEPHKQRKKSQAAAPVGRRFCFSDLWKTGIGFGLSLARQGELAKEAPLLVFIRWLRTLSPWAALNCVAPFFGSMYSSDENSSPAPYNYFGAIHKRPPDSRLDDEQASVAIKNMR
jgi:hypothetical protein